MQDNAKVLGMSPEEGSYLVALIGKFVKTSNPKCRLYWCSIECIDLRYSQSHCWYFWPSLVNYCPSNLLTGSLPPFLVWISTGVWIFTVCNGGGGDGIGLCGKHGVIHCVFYQIPNLQNCFTTPNKNLGGEGGLRQINTCRHVLYKSIFKKSGQLELESISYLVHALQPTVAHILPV